MQLLKNLFKHLSLEIFAPEALLQERYRAFKTLLEHDKRAHELMADLEDILFRKRLLDHAALKERYRRLSVCILGMIKALREMDPASYSALEDIYKQIHKYVIRIIEWMPVAGLAERSVPYLLPIDKIPKQDGLLVAGGKAANLAILKRDLGLPVPDSFVITTRAFSRLIEENGLRGPIDEELSRLDIHDANGLNQCSKRLMAAMFAARLPSEIQEALESAWTGLSGQEKGQHGLLVALRSSAVSEDGQLTFAGQYHSELNVDKGSLEYAYRSVIASKYSERALFYRITQGLSDEETPMAVLICKQIRAKASGVIHSSVQQGQKGHGSRRLIIYAAPGAGEEIVGGRVSADIFVVEKGGQPRIVEKVPGKETHPKGISAGQKAAPVHLAIDDHQALTLATWAQEIENHFATPQDIEWCIDQDGRLYILQARPLGPSAPSEQLAVSGAQRRNGSSNRIPEAARILISGGQCASGGVGAGRVHLLSQDDSTAASPQVPQGAIVVAKSALPQYAVLLDRVSGIITDSGSPAGHLALVAREFKVPVLVNTKDATRRLKPGQEVTMFAEEGVVIEGLVQTDSIKAENRGIGVHTPFFRRLEMMLSFIMPLNLTDPESENFRPEGCRTIHDIVRFCHERAVRLMFHTGGIGRGKARGRKLALSNVPIQIFVVDIGGGIRPEAGDKGLVTLEQVACRPLKALLCGLDQDRAVQEELSRFDWRSFDTIALAGGIGRKDSAALATYAVIAEDYLNMNMRFGYHFVVLDTLCSEEQVKNYILFRFAGGGGRAEGRMLRAEFIRRILVRLGFSVRQRADMIDARFTEGDRHTIEDLLEQIGRLAAVTQLMDIYLKDMEMVEQHTKAFFQGIQGQYHKTPLQDGDGP